MSNALRELLRHLMDQSTTCAEARPIQLDMKVRA